MNLMGVAFLLAITTAQRTNRLRLNLFADFIPCSILRDIFLLMGEISVHFNTKKVPNGRDFRRISEFVKLR